MSKNNNSEHVNLSTNILIKANDKIIGCVQNLSIKETAPTTCLPAVISGTCTRVRWNKESIVEAFAGHSHLTRSRPSFNFEIEENLCGVTKTTTF